jgi:hypothetical protein
LLQPLDVAFFGLLKKRLTAALAHLNEAQLVRIQKVEWMEAYIQARTDICNQKNIESAWRGAGLFPFNPQRALRTIVREPTPEAQRPKTTAEFDIFNQVFLNSSLPDTSILQEANILLNSTIDGRLIPSTPVCKYIRKIAAGTEQLQGQNIAHRHDANNLRSIVKKRTTRTKGKMVVLKGHFHIYTQELCDAVVEAEMDTKKVTKIVKKKSKTISYDAESEEEVEEGDQEESKGDTID